MASNTTTFTRLPPYGGQAYCYSAGSHQLPLAGTAYSIKVLNNYKGVK